APARSSTVSPANRGSFFSAASTARTDAGPTAGTVGTAGAGMVGYAAAGAGIGSRPPGATGSSSSPDRAVGAVIRCTVTVPAGGGSGRGTIASGGTAGLASAFNFSPTSLRSGLSPALGTQQATRTSVSPGTFRTVASIRAARSASGTGPPITAIRSTTLTIR